MSKDRYICKDCGYNWVTRKDIGRPANCPRCNSKRIAYNTINNTRIGFVMGISGICLFLLSLINENAFPRKLGILLGLAGLLILATFIAIARDQHEKNKKILKQFTKSN
ncbi:MAG: hypothetical protein AABX48_01695 [Nanoarchaeota archaeon]